MNWYNDTPEIKLRLANPLMRRIVELKEHGFADAGKFDYAPVDTEDALDNYDRLLEIVGDISENVIAANSENVDRTGPSCEGGRAHYAPGTEENLAICRQAGLTALEMPRRYGGLNMPSTTFKKSFTSFT